MHLNCFVTYKYNWCNQVNYQVVFIVDRYSTNIVKTVSTFCECEVIHPIYNCRHMISSEKGFKPEKKRNKKCMKRNRLTFNIIDQLVCQNLSHYIRYRRSVVICRKYSLMNLLLYTDGNLMCS